MICLVPFKNYFSLVLQDLDVLRKFYANESKKFLPFCIFEEFFCNLASMDVLEAQYLVAEDYHLQ